MSAGPQLHECPVCGAVGVSERIADHDCSDFAGWEGISQ